MKRNSMISIVLVTLCFLLSQIICWEQRAQAEQPKSASTASKIEKNVSESATAEPNSAMQDTSQTGEPKIKFEELSHDFGKISPGSKNECVFKFTNTGDGILKIDKTRSTCGCTVPKLSKVEYAPSESGTIHVKFTAPRTEGKTSKRIYVFSNDKENQKVALTIGGKIVKKVEHEPSELQLLLKKENAACPNITLTSVDGQEFSIAGFKSSGNCITAKFNSKEKAKKCVLEPKVDIEKLKETKSGQVQITLNHPQCKDVTIPFKVLSMFSVKPFALNILQAKPQKPITREIWILNNYNEDFEIESISSQKNTVEILEQEKKGNRYKLNLQIIPPKAKGKSRVFTDKVTVNIKGGEKVEFMCRGFYEK